MQENQESILPINEEKGREAINKLKLRKTQDQDEISVQMGVQDNKSFCCNF